MLNPDAQNDIFAESHSQVMNAAQPPAEFINMVCGEAHIAGAVQQAPRRVLLLKHIPAVPQLGCGLQLEGRPGVDLSQRVHQRLVQRPPDDCMENGLKLSPGFDLDAMHDMHVMDMAVSTLLHH